MKLVSFSLKQWHFSHIVLWHKILSIQTQRQWGAEISTSANCISLIRWWPLCKNRCVAGLDKYVRRLITARDYNHYTVEGMVKSGSPRRAHVCPISQSASITIYYLGNAPDTLSRSLSRPRFLLSPLSPSSFPSIFPRPVSSSSPLWYSSPPPIFNS